MRTIKRAILTLAKWTGGFWLSRALTRKGLRILCYHGFELADESEYKPKLFITQATFRRRLETLARTGQPVLGLAEALRMRRDGSLPGCAVVITVDDGFHNFLVAARLFREHGFPATVYATTYYLKKHAPIFRLVVQYMLWKSELAEIELCGRRWAADQKLDRRDPVRRQALIDEITEFGETRCTEPERQEICRELGQLLGVDYDDIVQRKLFSLMTEDEVRESMALGMDVQLHTHRHIFPEDEERARREIVDNRRHLEEITGTELTHFCYPSGFWRPSQWPWLEDLGVESAVTCDPGLNDADTPALGLKRFLDGENISAIEFEAELAGFLELLRRARSAIRGR